MLGGNTGTHQNHCILLKGTWGELLNGAGGNGTGIHRNLSFGPNHQLHNCYQSRALGVHRWQMLEALGDRHGVICKRLLLKV
jgi:hypothetical protein